MTKYLKQGVVGMLLLSSVASANAASGIQTAVIENGIPNSYELAHTPATVPCYVQGAKDHPEAYSVIVKILKETGFNIVDSDSVSCQIIVRGTIKNGASSDGKPFYSAEVLEKNSQWPSEDVMPNPQIAEKINLARNQAARNNGTPVVGGDGVNILTQAGGAIGGQSAALNFGVAGVLLNMLGSINPQAPTPEGVADVEGIIRMGSFMKTTKFRTNVFAASSQPEKPEALFYAGVKRVAEALRQAMYTEHLAGGVPFEMGCIHYAGDQPLPPQPAMMNPAPVPATCTPSVTPASSAQPDQAGAGNSALSSAQQPPSNPAQDAAQAANTVQAAGK